jgi:hypothetical protein
MAIGAKKIDSSGPVSQEKASVGMERSGSGFLVQLTMPSSLTLETAPEPVDSRITLRRAPFCALPLSLHDLVSETK